MEPVTVETHNGSRAAEYPIRFSIGKRKIEILRIEKRWLTPGCRCFKVLGDDDCVYVLQYNDKHDIWTILKIHRP